MIKLTKLRKWASITKWRITIGYGTVGILGMGLVIAKTVQDVFNQGLNLFIPMYYLFPLGVIGLWVAGYIYDTWGFYSNEIEYASERNTYFKKHLEGKNKKGRK